ncbi:MAG: hypothetical protein QOK11_3974, partial [Pseudonocardiales bacterium]|nr:hypothetical protein [Pseudonocardiales bacterium]
PADLDSYLRAHVSGSTSKDEAVFTAVGDMLRGGLAPAHLRAAAIRVLEHTGHVTATSALDTLGRPAIQITFADAASRPGEDQALLFDPERMPEGLHVELPYAGPLSPVPARYRHKRW